MDTVIAALIAAGLVLLVILGAAVMTQREQGKRKGDD